MRHRGLLHLVGLAGLMTGSLAAVRHDELSSLEGTWIMDSAYELRADGTRTTNYGEHPRGLLIVDHAGRYSMQIFKLGRVPFASGVKARGTPDEYRAASVEISTHIGRVTIDQPRRQLIFEVEGASFPNWEGKRQVRDYTYERGLLNYAVPASASGGSVTAHSLWRRAAE